MITNTHPTTEDIVTDDELLITEIESAWSSEIIDSIDTLRHELLDEMERLTAGDISTSLVRALSGACLRGLHFVLTGEGSLPEVTAWFLEATDLLARTERIATPTATRIHCLPQETTHMCQHGKKAA